MHRGRLAATLLAPMSTTRLEAFTDGVIAILITIMVLELKAPHGVSWEAIQPALYTLFLYILSFVFLGIYWSNHHHMFQATEHVNGRVLWANLHLLFWLSLVPFATAWMGENHLAALPTAAYGVILLAAIAYWVLQGSIIKMEGPHSKLARAVGKDLKGKISPLLYLSAVVLAFVHPLSSAALYVVVAIIWLVPDKRIERHLTQTHQTHGGSAPPP
jgi:uncharacterized membrane protein